MVAKSRGGVLVLDKASGPTSHDVVAQARRALGTRTVGHAGTLDPAATGILLVAFGEATKLVGHLMGAPKRYETRVQLGIETDSLDRDGVITERAAVPPLTRDAVEAVIRPWLTRYEQQVPAVSAVKVDGAPLYARVRRGEPVVPPTRPVQLTAFRLDAVEGDALSITLDCGKGFFVRSFARDLARGLGTVGHVVALRRTKSGPFTLTQAVPRALFERAVCDRDAACLMPFVVSLEDAWTGPRWRLSAVGVAHARHGRVVPRSDVRAMEGGKVSADLPSEAADADAREGGDLAAVALFDEENRTLVALAQPTGEGDAKIMRGFVDDDVVTARAEAHGDPE